MRSILCAALLCAASAHAGPAVFQGANVRVYAYPDACDQPELAAVLAMNGLPNAKRAVVKEAERMIPACYGVQGDKIVIFDADGDGGFIDAKDFKEQASI